MKLAKEFIVEPGHRAHLDKRDPSDTAGHKKDARLLEKHRRRLAELQDLLYADKRFALLIVLQTVDAGGKDGTIRHVMSGVNPQGCQVTSFKAPTPLELDHDFLWRVHQHVPPRGFIGIFNRSHYEDVLVARVHELVPKKVWSERYRQINDFEQMLVENSVTILKFYLQISREEQRDRLQARLSDPSKNWKLSLQDFKEREHWDAYMEAYEDALTKCSTKYAPWYVIPSNHKWFRNQAVSEIVNGTLERMKLHYPPATIDMSQIHLE
jgi:PPK2 family polyphosphate:nucleotide phosphotransferase